MTKPMVDAYNAQSGVPAPPKPPAAPPAQQSRQPALLPGPRRSRRPVRLRSSKPYRSSTVEAALIEGGFFVRNWPVEILCARRALNLAFSMSFACSDDLPRI